MRSSAKTLLRSPRWQLVGVLLAFVALAAIWRWTPLAAWLDPGALAAHAAPWRHSALAPVLVVAVFILASLMVMPIMALVVAAAILFGPLRGTAYSMIGIVLSAAVNYAIGRWFGRDVVRRLASDRIESLNRALSRRGVLAVAALRVVPVAPFTVVNVAAGAVALPLRDFMFGTVVGTMPGTILLSVFAGQLERTVRDADPRNLALLVGIVVAAVVLGWALRRYFKPAAPDQ